MQDWDALPYSEDGSIKGTSLEQYYNTIIDAFAKVNINVSPGPQLEKWFQEAGFVDVHAEKYKLPLGAWPKDKHYVCFFLLPFFVKRSIDRGIENA